MDTATKAPDAQPPLIQRLLHRHGPLLREMTAFVIVGVLNTAVFFLVYNVLRIALSPFQANAIAVTIGALANFYANRRFTFRIVGREGLGRQLLQFTVAFGLTLFLSTASLDILYRLDSDPSRIAENVALLLGTAVVIVARFLLLRTWVFGPARQQAASAPGRRDD